MKWLKRILLTLVSLVALLVIVGMMLPSGSRFSARSPSRLRPKRSMRCLPIAGVEALGNMEPRDPAMQIQYSGAAQGTGAKWNWQSKTEGNGAIGVHGCRAVQACRLRAVVSRSRHVVAGIVLLAPDGSGTRVTWTNEGDMGSSPINRYFGLMMDSMVGPDFDAGLRNLKALAERG
jgi:hypothetical protein